MSTKSTRSAGTQITERGVVQGTIVLDPKTGLPIDSVQDLSGKKRLCVDAAVTIEHAIVEVDLDADKDAVRVEDPDTDAHIRVETDGSINVNTTTSSISGDSILAVGTEDGSPSGTQHNLKIDSNKDLHVKDESVVTELHDHIEPKLDSLLSELQQKTEPSDQQNIRPLSSVTDSVSVPATDTKLDSLLVELAEKTEPSDAQNIRAIVSTTDSISVPGVSTAANQSTANGLLGDIKTEAIAANVSLDSLETKQDTANASLASIDGKLSSPMPITGSITATIGDLNASKDDVAIAGTEDGTATGTVRHFVNNLRQQILAAHDRQQAITYADFGTKNERITSIVYTSTTFTGHSAIKTISYSLVGSKYRRDSINWSIT